MSRKVSKGKGSLSTKKLSKKGHSDPKSYAALIGSKGLGKNPSHTLGAKGRKRTSRSGGGTWGEVT